MTGFEPGSSGVGIDHATNCGTTTAQWRLVFEQLSFVKLSLFATYTIHFHKGVKEMRYCYRVSYQNLN